jgi:hypothetical protein
MRYFPPFSKQDLFLAVWVKFVAVGAVNLHAGSTPTLFLPCSLLNADIMPQLVIFVREQAIGCQPFFGIFRRFILP